ncbi:MAG: potassium channel family protein [Pirellulaceae bacterium]|jgi:hypothetical protein|nr:potassium channel family protein [Pirellulaceae bacterium]
MATPPDMQPRGRRLPYRLRMVLVLVAWLLFAVAQPLASDVVAGRGVFDVLVSLLIAAVWLQVFADKEHLSIALLLGGLALLGIVLSHVLGGSSGPPCLVVAYILAAGFYAFALYGMLRALLVNQLNPLSGDAVFGAVCGYLLLGIIWSLLYCAVEAATPGSFHVAPTTGAAAQSAELNRLDLTYYSYVTLATVGYGDVTPITHVARTLAWTEAIVGQFYLAVLVAGLVGYRVAQATTRSS